jgi:CHASE3 domain sensor protein
MLEDWHEKAGGPEIGARRSVANQWEDVPAAAKMKDVIQLIRSGVGKRLMDEMRRVLAEFVRAARFGAGTRVQHRREGE